MQLTSPIVNDTNCISNSANNTSINNINHTSNNNNEMVVSESNKSPSHIINLFNHHHSTLTSPSASSTVPGSLAIPRDSFSCRKVFGVILVDERMIIRHLCGSSDLIDLEYKNHLLLGSIVVDKESMSIDELRRIITEQISNLPKNYAFFSKEGWPLTKSQECKLKFCNLVNKRNIICIRKVYDKPRIGALTDSGEYLGSFFCNYDCTLSDLRRILDDIFRDSENSSRLAKFMDYRFIDRNEWPVVRSHEDQLTLLDILVNQNVLLRPNLNGSFTSSCPAIKDARGDSNVGLEHDGRLTSLAKQIVTTPTSTDDRIDSWKGDTLRRSSKKRNIIVTCVHTQTTET